MNLGEAIEIAILIVVMVVGSYILMNDGASKYEEESKEDMDAFDDLMPDEAKKLPSSIRKRKY